MLFLAGMLLLAGLAVEPLAGRRLMTAIDAHAATRASDAAQRVTPALQRDLRPLGLELGAAVFVRIFKRENELELWMAGSDGGYRLFRTYPICRYSGELGPKRRQGDNQAPEGFYRVARGQLNPASRYHLAFNLGYPNAYERAQGYTGDFLMVHGNCVSIGCYAMGDAAIEEIYTLVDAALRAGQPAFQVHAFPFRLDDAALAAERHSAWFDFWSELKPGYDAFERTRRPPRVDVRNRRYHIEG
ncbi:MAG: murein L,D-transpeptidase [Rhodanobacteraceae bacterium]|nr:murein L,D-transpeptidase [Rhodanobacteraceae bacterium]